MLSADEMRRGGLLGQRNGNIGSANVDVGLRVRPLGVVRPLLDVISGFVAAGGLRGVRYVSQINLCVEWSR